MTKAATLAQQASSTTFNIPFRNRVINGAMVFDQRYNGVANTNVGSYGGSPTFVADRFRIGGGGGGARWTMQRVQDGPPGFQYSSKFTTTTASAPTAADLTVLSHIIEGYNVLDFAWGTASAQAASLSFWVKASVAGTYNVTITSGLTATYTTTYTVSAANVWEYETISIPACTSFTSGLSNDQGIRIDWALAVGSNYITATPNSWNASSFYGTSGAVQLSNNSGATWQLSGVQFEPGGSATSFDVRPYGVELGLCQRYYQDARASHRAYTSDGYWGTQFVHKVAMRTNPTCTLSTAVGINNVPGTYQGIIISDPFQTGVQWYGGAATYYVYGVQGKLEAEL